jgi:RHS repeat-associated protein
VAETTGLGTVAYEYDISGRRTQMTVNDLTPVTYTYDWASRLRNITQAPLNPVTIDYDAVGRSTKLTLPNTVSTEYQYDAASRLTALIYRNATGLLGDLTYTYDPAGNRTGVGGAFARTILPDPVPLATHDAANRQLTFGDKSMTYDASGNLTSMSDSSGTTTFTWDARNRLTALTGPDATASFLYDAFGRRANRQVAGQPNQYLYDGVDITQQVDPLGKTSYLRALNVDESFSFTNRDGTYFSIYGPLGSMLAVTDSAATPVVHYTYEPFGRTSSTNAGFSNPFQFTSRENDTIAGLYYYRARYYGTTLQRFMSEDPLHSPLRSALKCQSSYAPNPSWYVEMDPNLAPLIMFRYYGVMNSLGVNPQQIHLYAYVHDNPVNKIDPTGLYGVPQIPGCDRPVPDFNKCQTKCCDEHDDCYIRAMGYCSATSWLEQFFPYGKYGNRNRVECEECNSVALRCYFKAFGQWGRKDC